jgi:hypothetical protein
MNTYIRDEFTCWACRAVGKTFTIYNSDNIYDRRQNKKMVKLDIKQTARPTICDLCGYHDEEPHAMHQIYDNYGPSARCLHVADNNSPSGRRVVWCHTVCGFFLTLKSVLYGVTQEGTTDIGLEEDPSDERSVNLELQVNDEEEEDLFGGFAPSHHFVYYLPKERDGELVHTKWSRKIDTLQKELRCEICNKDDSLAGVYRIPVQCSAGEADEPSDHRVCHTDLFLEKRISCTRAFHVGCARYTDPEPLRKVFYYPGGKILNPVQCLYCPSHAEDVNKKELRKRHKLEEEKFQSSKANRKRKMAQKYANMQLTLFDDPKSKRARVDDRSFPPLERMKRDLAAKVVHIHRDEGKAWAQEQKELWERRLPDLSKDEFKAMWKQSKEHAFEVWNKAVKHEKGS